MAVARTLNFDTFWKKSWRPEFIGTLVFVLRQAEVLLIHKKTGHGAGKINGPGGKLDPNESVYDCAIREVAEEVGLQVSNLTCRAEMRFVELNGPQWLGFAFTCSHFKGDLIETPEAQPFWCGINEIPYPRMWPDDKIWLPKILTNARRASSDPGASNPGVDVGDYLFDDGKLLEYQPSQDPSIWAAINAD